MSDEARERAAVEHHRPGAEIVKARDTAEERRLDGAPNDISVPRWSRGAASTTTDRLQPERRRQKPHLKERRPWAPHHSPTARPWRSSG